MSLQFIEGFALANVVESQAKRILELTAERDALKSDAEMLAYINSKCQWDGFGYWLPDIFIKERDGSFTPVPTMDEFRNAIKESK